MRLGFLLGYIMIMWALIILGGFILIRIVAPIHLAAGELPESALKAAIAVSMVFVWIWIMVMIKNAYIRRRLTAKDI